MDAGNRSRRRGAFRLATAGVTAGLLTLCTAVAPSPAQAAPLLATAGDIACGPNHAYFNRGRGRGDHCRQLATSRLLRGANAVFTLGDHTSPYASYKNLVGGYDRSWGRFLNITRAVIGNHEYGPPSNPRRGARGYWQYFGEQRAGPVGRGWYSFDLGGAHVIALNSMCRSSRNPRLMQPIVGCGRGSAQFRWLKRDLRQTRSRCIVAGWHHPRFSSGSRVNGWPEVRHLWAALDRAGADIILSAHHHVYERFAPKNARGTVTRRGVRQFTVGTGGTSLGKYLNREAGSQRFATTFGVLKLRLFPARYRWKFVARGGRVVDRGSAAC